MGRSLGNVIADSLALSVGYAERLLAGMPADSFARFATPGGQLVESNHPAFVFGHLSLYAPRIVLQLEGDADALPPGFEEVFSKDAQCVDDPEGSIYPDMAKVVEAFKSGYQKAGDCLRNAEDGTLQKANPMEGRMAELFPTIGSMHTFYVGGHMMMHLGQVSAWRRMQGMGAA